MAKQKPTKPTQCQETTKSTKAMATQSERSSNTIEKCETCGEKIGDDWMHAEPRLPFAVGLCDRCARELNCPYCWRGEEDHAGYCSTDSDMERAAREPDTRGPDAPALWEYAHDCCRDGGHWDTEDEIETSGDCPKWRRGGTAERTERVHTLNSRYQRLKRRQARYKEATEARETADLQLSS